MTSTRTETQNTQHPSSEAATACVHHWRIEPPDGRESPGTCGRCGATRSFANATSSVTWERSNLGPADAGGPGSRTTRVANITLSDED